ncbi:MAG TPA: hypothetical protein VNN18_00190 [Candidatus Xenobia bacterium]|nr:hypothetical protein [Candidatus Xenobia bacterium]
MAENPAVHEAVERALAEALASIQRHLGEVQSSFEQVKGAVEGGEARANNFVGLLPQLVHMQASGASLAATVETVLRFVGASAQWSGVAAMPMPVAAPAPAREAEPAPVAAEPAPAPAEEPAPIAVEPAYEESPASESVHEIRLEPTAAEPAPVEAPPPAVPARFDLDSLPDDLKQLHQKAKRFAKVTVSDLILYKKKDVEQGRKNKDLYERLKKEIDDSKAMYDKRFARIAEHNIDYLYDELVRVLAENDPQALGSYPYRPSGA